MGYTIPKKTTWKFWRNIDKIPYEPISGIYKSGDPTHGYTIDTIRMVVHMFMLISRKNYEGIKDMFLGLSAGTIKSVRNNGSPPEPGDSNLPIDGKVVIDRIAAIKEAQRQNDASTFNKFSDGSLEDANMMDIPNKERTLSVLKEKYNIVGNVTTPVEYAASLLESSTSQEDTINLWNIMFELAHLENTKTDYMQDFIRKAEKLESFGNDYIKTRAGKFKELYFKERVSEKFGRFNPFGKKPEAEATTVPAATEAAPVKKGFFSNPFGKPDAPPAPPAPPATTTTPPAPPAPPAAPAEAPPAPPAKTGMFSGLFGTKPAAPAAAEAAAPVKKGWWGGVGRKSRKQGKSRNQNKSRKQGKSRKQRKTRK